jgi:deoxyribodipyrimidine photolyase-related protein
MTTKKVFTVFPNQLFKESIDLLRTFERVIVLEEPMFYHDPKYRPFLTNKVKLAYLRSCVMFFVDYLNQSGIKNVEYIRYEDVLKMSAKKYKQTIDGSVAYNPHDKVLVTKLRDHGIAIQFIDDSPMFLSTKSFMDDFYAKDKLKQHHTHSLFYAALRKHLNVLSEVKSTDKENRLPLRDLSDLPNETSFHCNYHEAGIEFASNRLFHDHVGNAASVYLYPCTYEQSRDQLRMFLKNKFAKFGPFQDAIAKDHCFLYHSILSPSMNIGILTPAEVVAEILGYAKKFRIPINSVEGFIRQVVGWRERSMYIYHYFYDDLKRNKGSDFWKRQQRLSWKAWYGETSTGIRLLDNEIKKSVTTGYAHHIVRLMIFMNVMVLSQIQLDDVYKWFMEVCAIDAYDWVMVSNIGSMGFFSDRFMSKPYLGSSNYLTKMSDYKLSKQERSVLDALFYGFLYCNKSMLTTTKSQANIYLRNLAFFEMKSDVEQKAILDIYKDARKSLTRSNC